MSVTDIQYRLALREAHPAHLYVDEEGEVWKRFSASYTDSRGAEMSFELWATSMDDAEARLKALKETGRIDGQILEQIDD